VLSGFENLIGSAFNDTLSGSSGLDQLFGGNGNDVFSGLTNNDTVFGGAGMGDTISFAGETLGVEVFLAGGFAAFGAGLGSGAGFSDIENATGGTGADRLVGDDLANVLNGGDGDDAIGGELGNDTLIGGAGIDVVQFGGTANATVNLSITTAQNTGSGLDVLSGFENLQSAGGNDSLTGSAVGNVFFSQGGNDTILGLAGDDEINAGEGDDLLIGGLGADVLRGNGGSDTASYATSAAGVSIVLNFGNYLATLGDAQGDGFLSIENFIGSAFADTLTGDDTDNVIEGGAGADSLNGGGGTNTLSYAGSNAAVTVNLAANTRTGGHATGDIVAGFVNLLGSAFNDTLVGDAGANRLTGGLGDDQLQGGAGADTLDGGGSANDTASYAASAGDVTVNLLLATQGGTGDAAGDVLIGIENLTGGIGVDFLTGDAGNNRIDGGAGSDVIEGGTGNDTLIGGTNVDVGGGAGRDTVRYSNATAGVTVSLAITTAQNTGGAGTDVISGFEDLNGSTFDDRLTGDALANIIFANDGNDTLSGGLGGDVLFGGSGADQFVFNTALGPTNVDTMVQFGVGTDKIVLENAVFTGLLATGALTGAQFALSTEALTTTDRIIYNATTGALFYDGDGSGAAVAVQFADVLAGNSAGVGASGLSASDFLII
jgi:Ca2+-binding RTX toxin-like protein